MTFASLKTRVRTLGGLDLTDAQAGDLVNERYREMVARSHWRTATIDLGVTVADQAEYALPANVVDLARVKVGSRPYHRTSPERIWELSYAGRTEYAFAPAFDEEAVHKFQLFPVPSTAGVAITGLGALLPTDMSATTDEPIVPADYHAAIGDGAIATGLRLLDERHDSAAAYEAIFEKATLEVGRRKNSRIGSGPVQIAVRGFHF